MKTIQGFLSLAAFLLTIPPAQAQEEATLASVYYWKAKAGKMEEYNRYIKTVAEPIDEEARKRGAFISVMTFVSQKDSVSWTHMRFFLLRDSVQLQSLTKLLDEATASLEPDEGKRKRRSDYAATLREFVAHEVVRILN